MIDQIGATLARISEKRSVEVGILLFPDVEVLDFAGPFEVFSVASRIGIRDCILDHPQFNISTIASVGQTTIRARGGLDVVASCGFANRQIIDVLIVPGGVIAQPMSDRQTLDWIVTTTAKTVITASVCTGAFLLAKAGLLDAKRVTTHWEDIDELRNTFPSLTVLDDVPYVDEGQIITSAGISAGIEMSLHIVARILGLPAAIKTARHMQYAWNGSTPPTRKAPHLRAMNMIYETAKERGATILVPTSAVDAMNAGAAATALNMAKIDASKEIAAPQPSKAKAREGGKGAKNQTKKERGTLSAPRSSKSALKGGKSGICRPLGGEGDGS